MKPDYRVKISDLLDDPDWDAFVVSSAGGHHVQTSGWAQVKSALGWEAIRILVTAGSRIVGGAQLLIRSLPVMGSAGYVTKGPLCCQEDPGLAEIVLQQIIQIGLRHRCKFMAIQPPNNGGYLPSLLESRGFHASDLELAPTASLVIDLGPGPEAIMAQMKSETRKHIHRSDRAGFVVHEGNQADLNTFYSLYLTTAQRQSFKPYPRTYFDLLWQTFAPRGWIALLVVRHESEAVCAQLLIPFGDTVIAKMVGWSGSHVKLRPNDALYWASIMWAIQHGYRYFDFEGVDPQGARSLLNGRKLQEVASSSQDIIKYGYGGKLVLYPLAYDYIPNKCLNWAYRLIPQHIMWGKTLPHRMLEILRKH